MTNDLVSSIVLLDKYSGTLNKMIADIKGIKKQIKSVNNDMILKPRIDNSKLKSDLSKSNDMIKSFGKGALNVLGFATKGAMIGGGIGLAGIGYALNKSGEMEQLQMAMSTMLKSQEEGKKIVDEMKMYAIKTPFEMMDLADTVRYALATGWKKEDLLGETGIISDVGNAASALGKGGEGLFNIMNQLSQMKMKGKAQAEEMRILAENGINAWEYLSKATGKSTKDLMALSEKGLIPAKDAIEAIRKGMRRDYAGMMIAQSKTLLGLWSSMKDVFNVSVMTKFGDGISNKIKPALMDLVNEFTGTEEKFQSFEQSMLSAGEKVGDTIVGIYKSVRNVWNDPALKDLSTGKKLVKLLETGLNNVNDWTKGPGKEIIESGVSTITDIMMDALEMAIPQFTEIGVQITKGILKGMITGAQKNVQQGLDEDLKNGKITKEEYEARTARFGLGPDYLKTKKEKKAIGIPYVPRDNYPALLHRGEAVVPARDNKDSPKKINIVMHNSINASDKADVDRFIKTLEDRLIEISNNMGYVD